MLTSLTARFAPALELNLVAVTTLLFRGSTDPTAISGVSTTATNFGGAVKTAALPNLTGNADGTEDTGVPMRGEGLTGVVGAVGKAVLRERRLFSPFIAGDSGLLAPDGMESVLRR